MYHAMRLRCLLMHPPLWSSSSSLGISASGISGGCFVRRFSAVGAPRPHGPSRAAVQVLQLQGRRRQRGGAWGLRGLIGGGEQRQVHRAGARAARVVFFFFFFLFFII